MNFFFVSILIFWFFILLKKLLFWIWFWQLKQYYPKRVIDHLKTKEGRKIIFSYLGFVKLALVFGLFIDFLFFVFCLFVVYLFEVLLLAYHLLKKNFRYPKITSKSLILVSSGLLLQLLVILFGFKFLFLRPVNLFLFLLFFDLFAPLIFSFLVLSFLPLGWFLKRRLIRKAENKIKNLPNLLVIGITGSYGKTSTKEILASILSKKFKVIKTPAHLNTDPAIATFILRNLDKDFEVFIVEMAAYGLGEIKVPCQMVKPKIGILTGINQQHLSLFGSLENIIKTKFELIEFLPEEGMAAMNWDSGFIKSKIRTEGLKFRVKNQMFYSIKEKRDLWAEGIEIEKEKISFRVFSKKGDRAFFEVNLIGSHNIPNILAAALVAHYKFGFSLSEIAEICKEFAPKMGAMVLKKGKGGLNVIDSTYSANPDGVISALDYLKVWQGAKKIVVMPCLIELGRASSKIHRKIGRKIAEVCDLAIITTKDFFEEINQGAIEKRMPRKNILFIGEPKAIVETIERNTKNGDVVLLEGRVPGATVKMLSGF
jgi:UDP-N-acetylmuramoyl-tripeptide--D-alanyl-D-alanine ligase